MSPESKSDPYFMESLARGLAVIRAFGQGRARLSGAQVASMTGLSRAAARRCLHTLRVLGYARASNGVFELTPAVLALGQAYLAAASIARIAQPVVERVADRLQESSGVAVLDGEEVVFIARAASRRILSVEISVGGRLPAAYTASGRVLLGSGDADLRAAFFSRVKLTPHTSRSVVDVAALRTEVERAAEQGYAIVDEELELGLRSMAVPIHHDDGTVAAALNVGVQAGRVQLQTMRDVFLPVLREAAREMGASLR